jgi:hypothetical protein
MTLSLRRIRRHWVLIALAAALFVLLAPIQAQAAFQVSVAASTSVGTGTLLPVTLVNADNSNCGLANKGNLKVTWTPRPGMRATGYRLSTYKDLTYQSSMTINSPATTQIVIPVDRGVLGLNNNYYFTIEVLYNNWISAYTSSNATYCGLLGLGTGV